MRLYQGDGQSKDHFVFYIILETLSPGNSWKSGLSVIGKGTPGDLDSVSLTRERLEIWTLCHWQGNAWRSGLRVFGKGTPGDIMDSLTLARERLEISWTP